MWDLHDVRRAIGIEQERAIEPLKFVVKEIDGPAHMRRVKVEKHRTSPSGSLDDALEDAKVWWPGEPPGKAVVRLADPDEGELILRIEQGELEIGALIWVHPVDFMKALKDAWDNPTLSERALEVVRARDHRLPDQGLAPSSMPLREAQRRAIGLAHNRVGLVHGPPGTGKTYTMGALVAHLVTSSNARIAICATTNTAVDQALVAVDKALERLKREDLRDCLKRVGSGYTPQLYEDRQHLIPKANPAAFRALADHAKRQPDKKQRAAWLAWRDTEKRLREAVKVNASEVVFGARVVATTAASILFNYDTYDAAPWDLLIVDEASQMPAAAAAMLATISDKVLFAGDPKQLPAVVQSDHPLCTRFLARTPFTVFEQSAEAVRLNEQSRMAPPICEIVSKVFYSGQLKVAADVALESEWHAERAAGLKGRGFDHPVRVVRVDAECQWSPKYQGRIRYRSMELMVAAAQMLIANGCAETDVWAITTYRAQRALLRNVLHAKGLKGINVTTVHRAQGGERKVVLFDPVEANSKFFLTDGLGDRLLNVALSRAMAHVSIFVSEGDLQNPKVRQIVGLASMQRRRPPEADQPAFGMAS